ncbi:MAG: ADP-ribosylglycohydrolase family protein [Thermomicrobiales bacterium]|nr:ADP-ribosylglycohydrolase family protein [Thermomicrobiales bacterium]
MPALNEDRFLGALLGFAIGDAFGMPVAGLDRAAIAARFGAIEGYRPNEAEDVQAGEVTEDTEVALAIIETLTTSAGELDVDMIGVRLVRLARSESRRWFPPATLAALDRAAESFEFMVPMREDEIVTADVAARGLPIGLLHAVGEFDPVAFAADNELVVRLSHGSPAAMSAATVVAHAARFAVGGEVAPSEWPGAIARELGGGEMAERLTMLQARLDAGERAADIVAGATASGLAIEIVPLALAAAIAAEQFEEAPVAAVAAGGAADVAGAIAGGLAGARFGSAGIPQSLVDDLGCRIYVSLAAPWFLKAARRRAGLALDLRPRLGGPRPDFPPRV